MEEEKGRRFLTYMQFLLKSLDFDVNQLSGYKPFLSSAFHTGRLTTLDILHFFPAQLKWCQEILKRVFCYFIGGSE